MKINFVQSTPQSNLQTNPQIKSDSLLSRQNLKDSVYFGNKIPAEINPTTISGEMNKLLEILKNLNKVSQETSEMMGKPIVKAVANSPELEYLYSEHMNLGKSYANAKDFEQARDYFTKAYESKKQYLRDTRTEEKVDDVIKGMANTFFQEDRIKEGIDCIINKNHSAKGRSRMFKSLSSSLEKEGKLDAAIECYKEHIDKDNSFWKLKYADFKDLMKLAELYDKQGSHDKAINALKSAYLSLKKQGLDKDTAIHIYSKMIKTCDKYPPEQRTKVIDDIISFMSAKNQEASTFIALSKS